MRTRKWKRSREEDPRAMRSWTRVPQRERSAFMGATAGGKWRRYAPIHGQLPNSTEILHEA